MTSAVFMAYGVVSSPLQAKVPSDLPSATLNRISEVIDTQLGYCRQLGNYISGALQVSSQAWCME